MAFVLFAIVAVLLFCHPSKATNYPVNSVAQFDAALAACSNGDSILCADANYTFPGLENVNKAIYINGTTEAGTIFYHAVQDFAISQSVTMNNVTVIGNGMNGIDVLAGGLPHFNYCNITVYHSSGTHYGIASAVIVSIDNCSFYSVTPATYFMSMKLNGTPNYINNSWISATGTISEVDGIDDGGGIVNLFNSTFYINTTTGITYGAYTTTSLLTQFCKFYISIGTTSSVSYGLYGGTINMINCTTWMNSSGTGSSFGVRASGTLTAFNSSVKANETSGVTGEVDGFYASTLIVANCSSSLNVTKTCNGGFYASTTATIDNCSVWVDAATSATVNYFYGVYIAAGSINSCNISVNVTGGLDGGPRGIYLVNTGSISNTYVQVNSSCIKQSMGTTNNGGTITAFNVTVLLNGNSPLYGIYGNSILISSNCSSIDNQSLFVSLLPDLPPVSGQGIVIPPTGTELTQFTFLLTSQQPYPAYSPLWVNLSIPGFDIFAMSVLPNDLYACTILLPIGTWNYSFLVSDDTHSLIVPGGTITVTPITNSPPVIIDSGILPVAGNTDTVFTFFQDTFDPENASLHCFLVLDSISYPMSGVAHFEYSTTLSLGPHSYYFTATDGFLTSQTPPSIISPSIPQYTIHFTCSKDIVIDIYSVDMNLVQTIVIQDGSAQTLLEPGSYSYIYHYLDNDSATIPFEVFGDMDIPVQLPEPTLPTPTSHESPLPSLTLYSALIFGMASIAWLRKRRQ